jgi:hypothetical protein
LKAPKDTSGEERQAKEALQKKHKVEEEAFGTYASQGGEQFVYRVKKTGGFGGYKVRKFVFPVWRHIPVVTHASLHFSHAYVQVITESTNKTMTREDLLQMRSKKKSDRYGNTILFSMRSFCHLAQVFVCKGVINICFLCVFFFCV